MDAAQARANDRGPVRYDQVVWFVFTIFLIFVLARYMQWGARRDFLATIRIEFLTGGIVVIASVLQMTSLKRIQDGSRHVFMAIGALLLAIAIQVPFAANRPMAQTVFEDRVVKFAMLAFLIAVQVRSPLTMRLFIAAFLLSMLYITQESVRGLISGGLVWQNQGVMRLHGAVPMYAHPNSLGGVSASVVPFCVFLMPAVKRWWLRLALLALLASALICVVYSGSRTAYVGCVGFVLGWFLISKRKVRWLTIGVVVGVVVVLVLPEQYKERFMSIGGEEAEGQSKEARLQILADAWQVFLKYPGGVGVSSFQLVRQRMFGRIQDTHNLYLEVATNIGVQGLIVFLTFVWVVGTRLVRIRDQLIRQRDRLQLMVKRRLGGAGASKALGRELDDLTFLAACAQATVFFLFVRLVVGLFGMDLYEIYWWFAAGMAIALTEIGDVAMRRARLLEQRLQAPEASGADFGGL
ncbi:MAG: O-antigen ligase family protein [Candidatus Krumholzibacteriia bacterium]